MRLGMNQPYFFAYFPYWQLINMSDKYVIYDDANYIKNSYIKKNHIKINGESANFGVRICHESQNKHINELYIKDHQSDADLLMKTLEVNYHKAAYYDSCIDLIDSILHYEDDNLGGYLVNLIKSVADYLGMDTEIFVSSELDRDRSLRREDVIFDVCRILGTSEYTNAIGGIELYDKANFAENGIELSFIKSEDIVYDQIGPDFIPDLSVIDVMMNNSPEDIKDMLDRFTLI